MQNIITSRTVLPVSVADCKKHLNIDADFTADDSYIEALIHAASNDYELRTNRVLTSQTMETTRQYDLGQPIKIYSQPVQSVSSVKVISEDGSIENILDYDAVLGIFPASVKITNPSSKPVAVVVRYVAGHSSASELNKLSVHAVKFLVAHFYQNREPVHEMGSMARELPLAYQSLVNLTRLQVAI